jgi:hypothetical protein
MPQNWAAIQQVHTDQLGEETLSKMQSEVILTGSSRSGIMILRGMRLCGWLTLMVSSEGTVIVDDG